MFKNQSTDKLIYLACPYSDKQFERMQKRFDIATQVAAILIKRGNAVFSPITQGHIISQYGVAHTFDAWKKTDLSIIEHWATDIFIVCLDGHEESIGVQAEIKHAYECKLNIEYILPDELILNYGISETQISELM